MSLQRLLVVTAVPFHLSHLQSNINKMDLKQASENELKNQQYVKSHDEKQSIVPENARVRLMRRKDRIVRNRISSQVSREKAKLRKELLEKQLLDLQIEHMKILLDHESMARRQKELEEENTLLRNRLENSVSPQSLKEENVAGTLKQASFVNISQQQKWVLLHLPSILMVTLTELLNRFQLQNFLNHSISKIHQSLIKNVRPMISLISPV